MKRCKTPCKECPYMKKSIPGYFGGHNPKAYAEALHIDTVVACHTKSKFDNDGDLTDMTMCIGHVLSQRKACKRSYHPDILEAWADPKVNALYEAKYDDILGLDFYEHHKVEIG